MSVWWWIEWCNVWCCGCQKWWRWWWAGSFYFFFWNHRDFTRHKALHKDLLNNAMRLRQRWSMIIFLKTMILPILLVERLWLWKFTFVQKCWKITHSIMILEKMPWMFEKWQLATAMCVNNCEDADSIICHWSSWSAASWMTHPAWYSMGAGGRAGKKLTVKLKTIFRSNHTQKLWLKHTRFLSLVL